jgi:predicted amino acid-binding ACT domain protein
MLRRSQPFHASNAPSALVGIMGDERAADIQSSLAQLQLKVTALEEQMRSQYTSVAAYASIAHEQVEFTRDEARADLDRTRQTLLDLVEQVRREASPAPRIRTPGTPPGPLAPPVAAHPMTAPGPPLATRLGELEQAITQCFDRQRELAETMAAVLDIVTGARADAPISSLAFT